MACCSFRWTEMVSDDIRQTSCWVQLLSGYHHSLKNLFSILQSWVAFHLYGVAVKAVKVLEELVHASTWTCVSWCHHGRNASYGQVCFSISPSIRQNKDYLTPLTVDSLTSVIILLRKTPLMVLIRLFSLSLKLIKRGSLRIFRHYLFYLPSTVGVRSNLWLPSEILSSEGHFYAAVSCVLLALRVLVTVFVSLMCMLIQSERYEDAADGLSCGLMRCSRYWHFCLVGNIPYDLKW